MDVPKIQAWWAAKQGLDGTMAGLGSGEVLSRAGWARSVGGANPYLAFHARAGIGRHEADDAVANLEICELPSARGCTYVVPREHYALALKMGQSIGVPPDVQVATKYLGVTSAELDRLHELLPRALEKGPLDPKQLKDVLGDAVRNLGEAGKKRGMSTTLPLALGRLQSQGAIRRLAVNGRLDSQRYAYALWSPGPLDGPRLDLDECRAKLAELYFAWIGPASITHFQWFSGLGVKAANQAVGDLSLEPLQHGSDLLMLSSDRQAFDSFEAPGSPWYSLVGSIDGITLLRRDVAGLLSPSDASHPMMGEKGLKLVGGVRDLASHAILDRGRLIGLWEYDPGERRIVCRTFTPASSTLAEVVARTEAFVRDELGDARSFSLDSPQSRAPRLAWLRQSGS